VQRESAEVWQLTPQAAPQPAVAKKVDPLILAAQFQFKRDLASSRFRRRIWISLAAAEALFLVVALVRFGSSL
jgi:hypothetical protein